MILARKQDPALVVSHQSNVRWRRISIIILLLGIFLGSLPRLLHKGGIVLISPFLLFLRDMLLGIVLCLPADFMLAHGGAAGLAFHVSKRLVTDAADPLVLYAIALAGLTAWLLWTLWAVMVATLEKTHRAC